jgi:hypothetical protein
LTVEKPVNQMTVTSCGMDGVELSLVDAEITVVRKVKEDNGFHMLDNGGWREAYIDNPR